MRDLVISGLILIAWFMAFTQGTPTTQQQTARFGVASTSPRTITLSMGELTAADHELADGYVAIGLGPDAVAIMAKPDSIPWLHLRDLRGKKVTLVVRVEE